MTTPLPVGPLTPYVTPEQVAQAPTGVDFGSIPPGRSVQPAQRAAELANICARATAMADGYCAQPLRATIDTVPLYAPGVRAWVPRDGCGPAKLIMKRWPVLEIVSIQVAVNTFPRVFTQVKSGDWDIANPVAGLYDSVAPGNAGEGGQQILLAPGYVDWHRGREGYVIEVTHVNGWPHAGIATAAAMSATSLAVDDCTGWAATSPYSGFTGATGTVYDAAGQEVIHATAASAVQGPGTLTLASPLQYGHAPGVAVSALPQSATWAVTLFAASQALTRGATSTTIREMPGTTQSGGKGAQDLADQARMLLNPFRRVI